MHHLIVGCGFKQKEHFVELSNCEWWHTSQTNYEEKREKVQQKNNDVIVALN